MKRQKAPKTSGPSQVLLAGASVEAKRRQLIKALLAQELTSANHHARLWLVPAVRHMHSHAEQFNQLRKQFVLCL